MRWLISAVILIAGGGLMILQGPVDAPAKSPEAVLEAQIVKGSALARELTPDGSSDAVAEPVHLSPAQDSPPVGELADKDQIIIIGEPMDPLDPFTWPQPENTDMIIIGEPIDPLDPSTWPQPENTDVIIIGEPIDPLDPFTWPHPENTDVIIIGEPMDPDDPYTWPRDDR